MILEFFLRGKTIDFLPRINRGKPFEKNFQIAECLENGYKTQKPRLYFLKEEAK